MPSAMSNPVNHQDSPVKTNVQYAPLPTHDPSERDLVKPTFQKRQQTIVDPSAAGLMELLKINGRPTQMPSPAHSSSGVKKSIITAREGSDAHHLDHPAKDDVWSFVDSTWFRAIVVSAFAASVVMIVLELNDSDMVFTFTVPNIFISGLLVLELWAKWSHYGRQHLFHHWSFVVWNILDVFFVVAAIADNLLSFRPLNVEDGALGSKAVIILRFIRLLQIVKILNIILDCDLSWSDVPWFQSFVGCVIGFNSVLMGFETDVESSAWAPIEQCLLSIYTGELLVRMKKQGVIKFISWENHDFVWNWLDLIIVVSSAADAWGCGMLKLFMHAMADGPSTGHETEEKKGLKLSQVMMLMRMLRLLRILRLVKLVRAVKPLYILVMGVSSAVQGVAWVLVLTLVTLYAMSIMSTRLIGHGLIFEGNAKPSEDCMAVFGTVPDSMFTLFRVMSGAQSEEESAKIDDLMSRTPSMKFGFVFFLVSSSWTLLSVLTAVVSEKMIGTCNEEQAEMNMLSYEEDRERHVEELQKLFTSLDTNHNGVLILKELEPVLADPFMAAKIAHICRVPVRNVRNCFHTLSRNGGSCPLDFFIESMLEVAKPATELSVMKILAQILDAQHQVEQTRSSHQGHMEQVLSVVEHSAAKHFHAGVEMEQRSAEQEAAYAQAIMQTELKNAAQEQAHSEAVMELVQRNMETINSILEAVNTMAVRQEDMEKTRIATDNALCARMDGMELAKNGSFAAVRTQIDSLISLHTCCDGSVPKAVARS